MGAKRQTLYGERCVVRRSQRCGQIGRVAPAPDGTLPQTRQDLTNAIGRLTARTEPVGKRTARRLRSEAEEIDRHLKVASTPTRYAEPTSFTPVSRASMTRYFPIIKPSPATGRQLAPLE